MAFKNEDQLRCAMEWFNGSVSKVFPTPTLVNEWTDDHQPCIQVMFGNDLFEFTFWNITTEAIWHIARSGLRSASAKIVWQMIMDVFEENEPNLYQFEGEQVETDLGSKLSLRIELWKTQVKNMEG